MKVVVSRYEPRAIAVGEVLRAAGRRNVGLGELAPVYPEEACAVFMDAGRPADRSGV